MKIKIFLKIIKMWTDKVKKLSVLEDLLVHSTNTQFSAYN